MSEDALARRGVCRSLYRARQRDPTNPDFQIKLADHLGMQGLYAEAVAIVERLEREETSPQYIQ